MQSTVGGGGGGGGESTEQRTYAMDISMEHLRVWGTDKRILLGKVTGSDDGEMMC